MDFSDKTMASPGSAYLGEVPGMVMNSIMLKGRGGGEGGRGGGRGRGREKEEEEEEEGNTKKILLNMEPKLNMGRK